MRRAFGCELLACPKCGGKLRLLGCILFRGGIAAVREQCGQAAAFAASSRGNASVNHPSEWDKDVHESHPTCGSPRRGLP
jgi:hypothetical protein